jgi:probable rRNA maturation factor
MANMPEGPAFARRRSVRASAGGLGARRTIARASAGKGLAVSVVDEGGRRAAAPGLAAWLRRVAPARARGVVSVALVSDRRVRELNRTYRKRDYATDVLSFPNPSNPSNPQSLIPNPFLGDIVIARGVARRQAREARHSEQTELRVLALHGLLHLLGYDHEQDQGRMLRVERRLRRKGGLTEGLIERAAPA